MPRKILNVLQVEDDAVDVDIFRRAISKSQITIDHETVGDGEAALSYLGKKSEYADAKQPDLILLDLNMPKKSGREVLIEIKKDPKLKLIPVIILTTSQSDLDITHCYAHGAACYLVKSADINEFTSQIKRLFDFWQGVEIAPLDVA